ncbi:glucokinase [Deinococcus metalli]|uniref:Glucokinase n=1 Tax=Deinococcus metalli TaxID=1141878 RepID=A0A7W8KE07_9DEIO|nr:ROK family protein [Deinococcus metalli]MBB5376449.1 glucokinase [Deinococcus metalli]GHF43954.1 glucokinase [Deinococcus metalli]
MTPPHVLALDVGGSHVTAGLVDPVSRDVVTTARRDLPHTSGAEELLDAWADALREVTPAGAAGPLALGVAVPSPFDLVGGRSLMLHKFPALHGVPLRDALRARLGHPPGPVVFGNDADVFALGEWWAGAARGCARMIGVTLGTGLGSGFVADGRIVTTGPDVPPDGELWNTPVAGGIAEDIVSGRALAHLARLHTGEEQAPVALAAAARAGSPAARAAFAAFGDALGGVLRPWVQHFRPEAVVLGGNLSRAFDVFAPAAGAHLPAGLLRPSERFEHAALLGAAALTLGVETPSS